ncbi:uncharacterized protein LOC111705927 [Eurytemora carolleeae]|uniref:uncharacterized protein LOC111705927 n=1 Tax=Eurytemora carolleeae TaxID=1294199 RepID=UPI000C7694D2|nr:uncharacterized protein LOC111705927 [Eurytemora carolleeae]|eukprot:XP_023334440.1 uncharacterized protein LOC111705927 [Eurytemora affinis]
MVSINSNGSLENDRDILVDCAWVTGYSSLSTLVIIFNSILFFSVGKNSYLHYSTHYTVLVLAVRNILYTIVCTCILLLTKIEDTPWMLKLFHIQTDQESGLLCEVLSCLDCLLSSLIMFYLLGLAVHMLCRKNYKLL